MKNKKMKLEDLKVQSFVTSMVRTEKQTIEGGDVIIVSVITAGGPASAVTSALTPVSASVSIGTLVTSILDATKADNATGGENSIVICVSDMCVTAYGWWCIF